MSNIASVLKSEISRVARKEIRSEMETLRKASVHHRSAIAALRRQVDVLQKDLRRMSKEKIRVNAAPPPTAAPAANGEAADGPQRRFSASRLAAHRAKLGVSGATYGKPVGIGGQTIYNWEQGRSRPNAQQIRQLAILKLMSSTAALKKMGVAPKS
ncbi:MAG: helix-turn-helix transcriptional regulator [Variovorax sp.]